jgi:hypothetical protein
MQVAEDNRINQKVLRMMLQANCAELTIVPDGQQAVDAYNKVIIIAAAAVIAAMLLLLPVCLAKKRCRNVWLSTAQLYVQYHITAAVHYLPLCIQIAERSRCLIA